MCACVSMCERKKRVDLLCISKEEEDFGGFSEQIFSKSPLSASLVVVVGLFMADDIEKKRRERKRERKEREREKEREKV